ncbi:MAG: hypothetical protein CEN92_353 [Candidatus Berkelbacteria bacterium Licking1014_96]|uniref:Helix-turn-helix domain-containing protein n=1 Tax=Candidatus Berkelbacteria bacterium Licking1014_96 TaxID=2017149 RepID=A0A554LDC4_9BACT|nr:MAG: hypothetical protein CEN92_353 [Candidatus Berkelbacteria bacterium Licking1014_96]
MKKDKKFYSVPEVAKILGVSRIAIFKKIKKGEIKAERIGRNYAIESSELARIFGKKINAQDKKELDKAISRVFKDYGETLRLLGDE